MLDVTKMGYDRFIESYNSSKEGNLQAFYNEVLRENILTPLDSLNKVLLDAGNEKINLKNKDTMERLLVCLKGEAGIAVQGESVFISTPNYENVDSFFVVDNAGETVLQVNGVDNICFNAGNGLTSLYDSEEEGYRLFSIIVAWLTQAVQNLYMFK